MDSGKNAGGPNRKAVIKRRSTTNFQEFRKAEAKEGRLGSVRAGSWSKMAIVKVNRRGSKER